MITKVSSQIELKSTAKLQTNVRHFSTSMCRGVRAAHFKSAIYLSGIGLVILGAIAWLFQ